MPLRTETFDNRHDEKEKLDGFIDGNQRDQSILKSVDTKVRVFFQSWKQELLKLIEEHDHVYGCVAYLTDIDILKALSKKQSVQILIQHEDFLRPDGKLTKKHLQKAYDNLPRADWHAMEDRRTLTIADQISTNGQPAGHDDPILQVKSKDAKQGGVLHHKFLVFWKDSGYTHDEEGMLQDLQYSGVWTGSVNITNTATDNLENAVYMESHEIAEAYMTEWAQILLLAERLDWNVEYNFERGRNFRLGT